MNMSLATFELDDASLPRPLLRPAGLPSPIRACPPVLDLPPEDPEPASRVWRVDARSSDEALARAACAGDPRAHTLISKRYRARVRSNLHRWIGPDQIDDHVQDVFVRLFEQLPRMREPAALRGFLVGITRRVACAELRRRRRCRLCLTETGDVPEPAPDPCDGEAAREALWRFASILNNLGPGLRRVFVLRYVEKRELAEVAARAEISVATAKRHLTRAAAIVSAMAAREPALAEYLLAQVGVLEPRFYTTA